MADNLHFEYFNIYCQNLSSFYILTWIFTVVALVSTWWIGRGKERFTLSPAEKEPLTSDGTQINLKSNVQKKEVADTDKILKDQNLKRTESFPSKETVMRRYKAARQVAIEEQLKAALSDDQIAKEQEVESAQLTAIFNLLKQQEDKFKIKSMDELQEQMKNLYRA